MLVTIATISNDDDGRTDFSRFDKIDTTSSDKLIILDFSVVVV